MAGAMEELDTRHVPVGLAARSSLLGDRLVVECKGAPCTVYPMGFSSGDAAEALLDAWLEAEAVVGSKGCGNLPIRVSSAGSDRPS